MMKILLVLPRFDRRKWDTLTDQTWNLARLITASGQAQCEIAAFRNPDEVALEVVSDVPVHRFKTVKKWSFRRLFRRKADCEHVFSSPGMEVFLQKHDFDIVHLLCADSWCQTAADILRERNIPYVVYCRSEEVQLDDAASAAHAVKQVSFGRRLRSYGDALKYASRIFCGDQKIRRLLAERLGDRRLLVWYPGVDLERFFRPSEVDFRKFYQLSPARKIILSVGRICENKNQKLLLELISVLNSRGRNCQLVVIGGVISDQYMTEFEDLVNKRNLSNFVTVIPGLSPGDERFPAAFQSASLLLLPSRYDVSGSAVLEAWCAGVPVVASPVGTGGDLIEDRVNGRLVRPQDFQEYVNCCESLLDDRNRAELEKMRSAGIARAREMSFEKRSSELLAQYKEVLEKE